MSSCRELTVGRETNDCGDVILQFSHLTAGLHTILLSDAGYDPNAVFEVSGKLGDGFTDFTSHTLPFTTCDPSTSECINDTGN
jgi:hypothetical protein